MTRCRACNANFHAGWRKIEGERVLEDLCVACRHVAYDVDQWALRFEATNLDDLKDLNLPFDDDDESTPPE